MTKAVLERPAASLPDDGCYARNLIGGLWQFPAAPYEFEIRNPGDSTITAVVPLSSRFDVTRAFHAATSALRGQWASPTARRQSLYVLLDRIDACRVDLAHLQSVETGISVADSLNAVKTTLAIARACLRRDGRGDVRPGRGVTGHILSWGLPFTEVVTSVLPALLHGDTVIVKPSLRGPLSPVAFAHLATEAGLPAGVVNVIQGTGGDVGAELITRRDLSALFIRAGERVIARAERGHERSGVPLRTLRAGGNVMIVGNDTDDDVEVLAEHVATAVRVHSNGGPFGLPLLAVHRDRAEQVRAAILDRLGRTVAAPLPTEPVRSQALARIRMLIEAGANVLLGGPTVPDDIEHRMGWRIPPTVLDLSGAGSAAVQAEQATVPLGPVLATFTWHNWVELGNVFTASRATQATATLWGTDDAGIRHAADLLPHGHVRIGSTASSPYEERLPAAWLGGTA